jgi:tRNA nucleotidyltransferase/poly(A) polymerase
LVPHPVIVPRDQHPISRRDIDPDALRVLYRLQQNRHTAYLVGGSVRDLLLGRRPKDFDIGTDAQPSQIKRLFRNCWIIGRRFRLAHIKFGEKTIEVATFRKIVPEPLPELPGPAGREAAAPEPEAVVVASAAPPGAATAAMIHRDNTFGTPEEDAFRRDFTVNALFYDIATFSVIDYVGGLADLERRVMRSIGDPKVRFVEDPVRMLRAAVFGARLGFDLDEPVTEAIALHRHLLLKASPARLMEEYYKILRSGYAEASFRALARVRLLEVITPDLASPPDALWDSLARLDRYRQSFPSAPAELTTVILSGSLLEPLGVLDRRPIETTPEGVVSDRVTFGMLPISRKDLDRLRQVRQILPRLTDPGLPPRVVRGLPNRPAFADAVTWLEIFGDAADFVERWKHARQEHKHQMHARKREPHPHAHHAHPQHAHGHHPAHGGPQDAHPAGAEGDAPRRRRRRRRRRGRGRGGPQTPPQ